jgi:hypothetical protein
LLVGGWYGRGERTLDIVSAAAGRNHPGRGVPVRYVLVRDPAGELEPQAFLCTDLDAATNGDGVARTSLQGKTLRLTKF